MSAPRRNNSPRRNALPSDAFILGTPATAAPPVGTRSACHSRRRRRAHHLLRPLRACVTVGPRVPARAWASSFRTCWPTPARRWFSIPKAKSIVAGGGGKSSARSTSSTPSASLTRLPTVSIAWTSWRFPHRDPESDLQTLAELFARGQSSAKTLLDGGAARWLRRTRHGDNPRRPRQAERALRLRTAGRATTWLIIWPWSDTVGEKLPPAAYREIFQHAGAAARRYPRGRAGHGPVVRQGVHQRTPSRASCGRRLSRFRISSPAGR